jgi:murein DD-endopeptidase MepM/ murein hydrolase activator NlpD
LARHRSPSGAEADDPERTMPLRVVSTPGSHRLPPPSAVLRGRVMVAAVAAGGVVAAGQTLATPVAPAETAPPPVASALQPVAEVVESQAPTTRTINAIGGDQLVADPLALGSLDATAELDVAALTKAAAIGEDLARQAAIVDAAESYGATDVHLIGDLAYVRPTEGRLTSAFGARWGTSHQGIDIANEIGTPIYALTEGVVEEAGPASGFGLWVVVRHPDGTQSVYGHVNRIFVDVGQEVEAGEEIAELGNRGQSTGPHLHFEIWDEDGTKLNPIPWLQDHGIVF